eukprot:3933935-Rhodomonas_salina.5
MEILTVPLAHGQPLDLGPGSMVVTCVRVDARGSVGFAHAVQVPELKDADAARSRTEHLHSAALRVSSQFRAQLSAATRPSYSRVVQQQHGIPGQHLKSQVATPAWHGANTAQRPGLPRVAGDRTSQHRRALPKSSMAMRPGMRPVAI